MVKKGTFREDLYYRLNVVNLSLPPLRERVGDIPLLVEFFLTKFAGKSGKERKTIAKDAVFALESYAWPGNIRQLENELQRAQVMAGSEPVIARNCLSPSLLNVSESGEGAAVERTGALKESLEALEREMIIAALKRTGNNKSEAARQLGISRSNLIAKAQSFGLE
jgi:transcriptional regulator with PAS, ATPase and Fis domain